MRISFTSFPVNGGFSVSHRQKLNRTSTVPNGGFCLALKDTQVTLSFIVGGAYICPVPFPPSSEDEDGIEGCEARSLHLSGHSLSNLAWVLVALGPV